MQDSLRSNPLEITAALDKSINSFQNQLSSLKSNEKVALAALAAFAANPRLSDLRQDIQRLEEERDAIQAHLAEQDGDTVDLSAEERLRLGHEWKQWQRQATDRSRICRQLWSRCTEILPNDTTSQELWESLGLEGEPH
ncbi:uncharacterized protein N7459_000738 [Penicillium hispanicum]|uniref:uncharacterized protein n=1 Tax=Penicillium hispanicum TaxID=1080232 RepID=UPI002541EF80|nr:uncharacterized protein N7459_000738 [Penicillium hispanicum]KAJ5594530.1 hypothetical protein N7459_000738 [Penicillium hispanicum]